MSSVDSQQRVLSGMRPTGRLHLGHYHGVIRNWIKLQHEYECFLFVADWHALTTDYENPKVISENIWDMVIDWLAAGVSPNAATLFIQSKVPEHAELHLLLSMMTPLGAGAKLQGYAGEPQGERARYLWFSGIPPIAKCGYSDLPGRSGTGWR